MCITVNINVVKGQILGGVAIVGNNVCSAAVLLWIVDVDIVRYRVPVVNRQC
jgi:hypothetical protein